MFDRILIYSENLFFVCCDLLKKILIIKIYIFVKICCRTLPKVLEVR